MGYVGDQLGLHPFGLELILSGCGDHIRQTVQFSGEFPEGANEQGRVDLAV